MSRLLALVLAAAGAAAVAPAARAGNTDPVKADAVKANCNKSFEATIRWGASSWMWKDGKKEDVLAVCDKVLAAIAERCKAPQPKDNDWTQLASLECMPTSKDKNRVRLGGGGHFSVDLAKAAAADAPKQVTTFMAGALPSKK